MFKLIFALVFVLLTQYNFCWARIEKGLNYYGTAKNDTILMKGEKDGVVVQLPDRFYLLLIDNNSNFPIEFNYSSDKCYYITRDGKQYSLPFTDGNEPYFEDGMATLNPEEKVTIMFERNTNSYQNFRDKYNEGKIKELLLEINYGKTRIRLTPSKK